MSKHKLVFSLLILLITACLPVASSPPALPYGQKLQDALDAARESASLVGISAAIIVPGYDPWLGKA